MLHGPQVMHCLGVTFGRMGAASGLSPRAPRRGCPADTGVEALQESPLPLFPQPPVTQLGWERAGRVQHLCQCGAGRFAPLMERHVVSRLADVFIPVSPWPLAGGREQD